MPGIDWLAPLDPGAENHVIGAIPMVYCSGRPDYWKGVGVVVSVVVVARRVCMYIRRQAWWKGTGLGFSQWSE